MLEKKDKKTQDIIELLRLSMLRPDQVELMLTQFILTLDGGAECEIDFEKLIIKVKQKLFSKDFLKDYAQSFDKRFNHNEIKLLIKYYKSNVFQKMYEAAPETIVPLYSAVQHLISSIARPVCSDNKHAHL